MELKLKPHGLRIVAQLVEEENRQGGLYLPDNMSKNAKKVKVIESGPGENIYGHWVESLYDTGDILLVPQMSGTEVAINGDKYIIINQNDVLVHLVDEQQ